MKKIVTVVALSSAIMLAFTGCGQKSAVAPTQAAGQMAGTSQKARNGINIKTPEFSLMREVTSLERLQRGSNPLTKDQIAKIVPILTEIKAKDTVDQTYADTETKTIEAVLTDAQKTELNSRPQRGNNPPQGGQNQNGQQGSTNSNGQPANGNGQPANKDSGQRGNWNGQPGTGNGQQGMNLKDVCTRVIDALQNGTSQSSTQGAQQQ